MKVCYLGAGVWGFCLANLLASKGYQVSSWTIDDSLARVLNANEQHPNLPGNRRQNNLTFTTDLAQALEGACVIVESVTAEGLRPVLEQVKRLGPLTKPFVVTSKGIEQHSTLILPELVLEIFGAGSRSLVGCLSGPGYACEMIRGLPTGVVCSAYEQATMMQICQLFNAPTFRVYPNSDLKGVAFGGALKNIIAIACGIAEGLTLGSSCKAALMTRGLHEMRKLAVAQGCKPETLYGLSGMGDLAVTCSSESSRNFRFGKLLAEGKSVEAAKTAIRTIVEGAYTCVSALQLSRQLGISMPITEGVYKIIYEGFPCKNAVALLMQRAIKEEHL